MATWLTSTSQAILQHRGLLPVRMVARSQLCLETESFLTESHSSMGPWRQRLQFQTSSPTLTTFDKNCSMLVKTRPSTYWPSLLMVKTGCSCQNSNIKTTLDRSCMNGTQDSHLIQQLSPLHQANSCPPIQTYQQSTPSALVRGLTEPCAHGQASQKKA